MESSTQSAIVLCEKCGCPWRVVFEGDEIVKVLAPCIHKPKLDEDGKPIISDEQSQP